MKNKDCVAGVQARVGWGGGQSSGLFCPRVPGQCHYSSTVVKARVLMLLIWEEGKGEETSIYLLMQWHRNLHCTACFCPYIACVSEKHARVLFGS